MPAFQFLFGKKNSSSASIGDKLKTGAHSQLHGKIIRSQVNRWWVVLLRHYLFWPVVKFPFLPVVEAIDARRKFVSLDRASDLLADAGFKTRVSPVAPLRKAVAKKSGILPAARLTLLGIFWKEPPRRGRDAIGHVIMSERHLCQKIYVSIFLLWTLSAGLYIAALRRLLSEGGVRRAARDFGHFVTGDFVLSAVHGQSTSFKIWLASATLWLLALVLSFVLVNRPWIRMSGYVRDLLSSSGIFKTEEMGAKVTVVAMSEVVFLSAPNVSVEKIRRLVSGWPAGFQPGEIIENTKKPDDFLILNRPDKKPIIFGGEHARSDVLSHLKAYEQGIVQPMTEAVRKKSDPELIFLGEVIESRWWESSAIYMSLANSPHVFVCGQTRSGKTKTVLSFIYSFARAYPGTQWLFCDGKGSPDYDPMADYLSVFPVAKPDDRGDPLIQFANVVDHVWAEYAKRKALFSEATMNGKPCSSIYQYRELVGELAQVWLVVDEFSVFLNEMSFEQNWRTDGTIANRLKRLAAEAASVGIHLLFASQRYQVSDMPSVMRSNLTTRMVHNVQLKDADLLETPEATTLDSGQFYVTAAGLYSRHTGLNKVRAKLPYIGDMPDVLLSKTVEPITRDTKKEFDLHLIYNKGSDDMEKMSVSDLCMRLQRFFRDQEYTSQPLTEDLEATELQLEIRKATAVKVTKDDGTVVSELRAAPDAPKIGVSVLRVDEIDEDTLFGIQAKYNMYSAIIVFVLGKSLQSSRYKFVTRLNEMSTRFCVVPFREYFKDMRYVEMKRKQGLRVDVISPKLSRLGLGDVSHAAAALGLATGELTSKSPAKLKISKILEMVRLEKNQTSGEARGVPYTSTVLPGGTELYFLILAGKNERDDARELAMSFFGEGKAVVIVTNEKFTQTDARAFSQNGIQVWRVSQLDEILMRLENKDTRHDFVHSLMKDLRLVREGGTLTPISIGKRGKIAVACQVAADTGEIVAARLTCEQTGYTIVIFKKMLIEHFRLDTLGIPATADLTVTDGVAPLGTDPARVTLRPSKAARPVVFPADSKWEVVGGVLAVRKDSIGDDDPLLTEMKKR